jgi:hypothetical protein
MNMTLPSSTGIDEAMAKILIQPSSSNALDMVREARRLRVLAEKESHHDFAKKAEIHLKNCRELHGIILTLESDPEIVKRNILARTISGIFPLLNTIEEFKSLEDQTPFDIMMNGLGIISELAQATQYLEATRLSSIAKSESALIKVEDRLVELALETPGDPEKELKSVENFMDSVRALKMNPRDRPFIPFMLWIFITVISYKRLKDLH